MKHDTLALADAQFEEMLHARWRNWRRYLQSSLVLLELQTAHGEAAFEQEESREESRAQAEQQLASIPQAERAAFVSAHEDRRQELQRSAELDARERGGKSQLPDPDQIDHDALTELLSDAEGNAGVSGLDPGWGEVPVISEGELLWYQVHAARLLEAPGAAAYAAAGQSDDGMRWRLVLAGALTLATLIFLGVWFAWPRGIALLSAAPDQPTVNGAEVAPWPARELRLTLADQTELALPLAEVRGGAWPAALEGGAWRSARVAPVTLCAPARQLGSIARARLASVAAYPERSYAPLDAGGAPDLRIEACEGPSTVPAWLGRLESARAAPLAEIGAPVALTDALTVTVERVTIVGAGEEPALAPDAARVDVLVAAPDLDWPAYRPTLLLGDGTRLQTPEVTPTERGARLSYRVARPAAALDLVWSLLAPQHETLVRWRATLAPPPERAALLREQLTVASVRVVERAGGAALLVELRSTGDQPLQLTPADLALTRRGEPLPALELPELREPLAPGEARVVTIPLAPAPDAPDLLTIGARRWQIA